MGPVRKATRYAHADGHTDVCYSEDGKYMITCGSDGDARIWEGFDDDDPYSTVVAEKAITVAFKGDRFYIGSDNNNVMAYSFEGKCREGIVTRFTAPVTHVNVSRGGKIIVSGSCDMNIHITDKETLKDKVLSGHKAPILGVAIDPKEKYLASSSCDGSLKIWGLSEEKELKSWNNILDPCNDFFAAKALGRADWTPETGSYLAIPGAKDEGIGVNLHLQVILVERGSWNTVMVLSDDHIKKPVSIAAFSPCGGFLAASALGGEFLVWDISNAKTVVKECHEARLAMTGIAWNPSGNGEIAFCDVEGQFGLFEECLPKISQNSKHLKTTITPQNLEGQQPFSDDFKMVDDDDDEDDENVISLEKIKAQVGFGGGSKANELENLGVADVEEDDENKESPFLRELQNLSKAQEPFQPTSTPVHLQQRFMVWNSVGIVRCFNTQEENSIDVEFHDSSVHHPINIRNYLKHTMAALTDEALLLACEIDTENPSKLVCIMMNSWDGSKEWNVEFPEGEEAVALGAGRGWAAVASDSYSLRFFTIGGCQHEVMSIPGRVVCLAGHENQLAVVFHGGIGVNGDQCLFYQIVVIGGKSGEGGGLQVYPPNPLPLSHNTTLFWIGFTDEGSLATQDSSGIVRLLFSAKSKKGLSNASNKWIPICKTNANLKSMHDHYFVLGVSEKYQNVRCVLCKGSHYPQVTPRPSVVELNMQMPLCEAQTEKSQLEEKFWRSQLFTNNLETLGTVNPSYIIEKDMLERTLKETVIKLFALACRSDLDFRAVELCKLMPSSKVVMLAEKYASKLGKKHLADRINAIVIQKLKEEEMQEEMLFGDTEERNSSRKLNSPLLFSADENGYDTPGTPVEFSGSPACSGENENILLSAKQRTKYSNILIKPSIKPDQNPFKKTPLQSERKEKGLSCFSTTPTQTSKSFKQSFKQNNTPEVLLPQPKVKQTKLLGGQTDKQEKLEQKQVIGGLTYMQWFVREKESFEKEFPDLNMKELTKIAVRRYKELKQEENVIKDFTAEMLPDTKADPELVVEVPEEENSENLIPSTEVQNKRKSIGNEPKDPSSKKMKIEPAISKLSAFIMKNK